AGGKVYVSVHAPPLPVPSGGTARMSVHSDIQEFDPALAFSLASQAEYAACAMLVNYPDAPGAAGLRLVPDAAPALPPGSDGGRPYTFLIRPDMRFSPPSNALVTAQTFKHTIERALSPQLAPRGFQSPGQQLLGDIAGAPPYIAGKARHISGITALGD